MPLEGWIHARETRDEVEKVELHRGGLLYLRHLAITIHKDVEGGCGVVNCLDAFAIWGGLKGWRGEIRLAYTENGCCGVVDFVGKHTGEFLPRLHLVLCSQSSDVVLHVVEGVKQCFLAKEHPFGGHTEGEVAIAHCLTHEEGHLAQAALTAIEEVYHQRQYRYYYY